MHSKAHLPSATASRTITAVQGAKQPDQKHSGGKCMFFLLLPKQYRKTTICPSFMVFYVIRRRFKVYRGLQSFYGNITLRVRDLSI
jgi:hypothetical protein